MRILIVEDDEELAKTLSDELRSHYAVDIAISGKEGEVLALSFTYDLILLDYNLPDIDGVTLCKRLRNELATPILMLTGRAELKDKVTALDAGVDDYITKPFIVDELLARMRAVLRRPKQSLKSNILIVGDLKIDLNRQKVKRGNKSVRLRRKEFSILEYLARNAGRIVSRDMILEHVWESASEPDVNIVDVHIKYLRDHIDRGFEKRVIKTVYGVGYTLDL